MKKLLIFILLSITLNAYSINLTDTQLDKIEESYEIGKSIVASDGTSFEKILPAMLGTETSFGKFTLGDKYYKSGKKKPYHKMSFGCYQIKLSTAIETINKYPELKKKYSYMLKNRDLAITLLRYNHRISADIAGHYLLSMYEHALKKGYSKSFKRAIGRYNGGWNNMKYANKVIKKMKIIKYLVEEGEIDV